MRAKTSNPKTNKVPGQGLFWVNRDKKNNTFNVAGNVNIVIGETLYLVDTVLTPTLRNPNMLTAKVVRILKQEYHPKPQLDPECAFDIESLTNDFEKFNLKKE